MNFKKPSLSNPHDKSLEIVVKSFLYSLLLLLINLSYAAEPELYHQTLHIVIRTEPAGS